MKNIVSDREATPVYWALKKKLKTKGTTKKQPI